MTHEELEIVKEAQYYARIRKNTGKTIACPFAYVKNFFSIFACRLCHKWMGTIDKKGSHPCNQLPQDEVRRRFWASSIHETSRRRSNENY